MTSSQGQVAFEYMIIVGLVLLFLIPLWAYLASVREDTIQEISTSYAESAVNKIASSADLVFSQGPPAKVRTTVYIPSGVSSTNIIDSTIIISVYSGAGISNVSALTIANITGALPTTEGNYQITIEAIDDYVSVSVA